MQLVAPLETHFSLLYALLKEHIADDVNYKVLYLEITIFIHICFFGFSRGKRKSRSISVAWKVKMVLVSHIYYDALLVLEDTAHWLMLMICSFYPKVPQKKTFESLVGLSLPSQLTCHICYICFFEW